MADQRRRHQNVGVENMNNDVKLWHHKQRTPNTNDTICHWMKPSPMKNFCVRHCSERKLLAASQSTVVCHCYWRRNTFPPS